MQVLEKLTGSNTVTLVWIPEHHGIPGNEEADKLAKEGTKVPSDHTIGIPFAVGKEVIMSHLREEHMNRWKTCTGCYQSNMLMSEPPQRRAKELQAMLRLQLKVAVGLLTGHTTLRAHMFRHGLHNGRTANYAYMEKKMVCILYVWHWHAKDTEPRVVMFFKPKDLENVRVNSLTSLIANTRLGTVP